MNNLEEISAKIQKIQYDKNYIHSEELILPPAKYGPFFNKFLLDFIKHHNLPSALKLPENQMHGSMILSRVLDIMAHSMGVEKRDIILKELKDYRDSLYIKNI